MRPGAARGALAAMLCIAVAGVSQAANVNVRVPGADYNLRVTSLKEARYRATVRQQYDFSCGSAATATLLTHQYGFPVTETDVFKEMYATGDQKKIRREGFSLLDMRRYLMSKGFQADGFKLPLEKLEQEGLPAIVLLNDKGYRHFVVVKGVRGERVLLGDPARGTRTMNRETFDRLWDNRVLFVVHNRRESAQFNTADDWRMVPGAPLDTGIQRRALNDSIRPRLGPGDI